MSYKCDKIFPSLPKTERGAAIIFGADPKNKNICYCNGNSVIIRDLKDPSDSDIYTQHSLATTVAKYSPSGFYIASADMGGKVRIWDTVNKEHILKCEYQPFAGRVKDLAWSGDSQRMVVGGEGREVFGSVFLVDTGTSNGEIMGMNRPINAVDIKSNRPFRLVTASEDFACCYFEGPPFKFKKSHLNHKNFANCCRYSPDGNTFTTAGADGYIYVYDGKTGELKHNIGDPAHKGGIYGLSYSPESDKIVTVSGDKTVRIWNVESKEMVQEYAFANHVDNLLLGCLWAGDTVLVCSLSGDITLFSSADLSAPTHVFRGHNKPITGLLFTGAEGLVSASSDGKMGVWNVATGECQYLEGTGHKNQVQGLDHQGDVLVSVGIDDTIVFSSLKDRKYQKCIKLDSQPRAVSMVDSMVGVACYKEVIIFVDQAPAAKLSVDYEPSSVALSPDKKILVAGGQAKGVVVAYSVAPGGASLTPLPSPKPQEGSITSLAFSPNGTHLAVADSERRVTLYKVASQSGGDASDSVLQLAHDEFWRYHAARVNCLAWSPNGKFLASGSLDCSIIIWSVDEPKKRITITNAHPTSQITGLAWSDDKTLFSSGQDSNIRKWIPE